MLAVPHSEHSLSLSPRAGGRSGAYLSKLHVVSLLGVLYTYHTIHLCSICEGWEEEEVVNSLEVHFLLPF